MDYAECWKLQTDLFDRAVEAKRRGESPGQTVLFVEHPPVYTLGKSGHDNNLLVGEEFLQSIGASFFRIDRGGDITFHGPGQIVGYPILDLEQEGLGLKEYIGSLEKSVIDTVAEWGIRGRTVEGAPGVWIKEDKKPLRKICAIGVRSSRWITMHGFALNVNTDLRYFDYINPCGFTDRTATSMEKEVGHPVDMAEVKKRLEAHLKKDINVNKK